MVKKIELTAEQIQRCFELHAKRLPYSKIGEELHVDRRIVAKIIKAKDQSERLGRLADARRDVAAGYFKEHISNLELLSRYLLELTIPPQLRNIPLLTAVDLEVALFTKFKGISFSRKGMDHSLEEGSLEGAKLIDMRIAEKEARETIQAHKEHFPVCWQKIRQWEKLATQYNSAFDELEKLSKIIQISPSLIRSAVFTLVKAIQAEDVDPEQPMKTRLSIPETSKKAATKLLNHPLARRSLLLLLQSKSGFEDVFKQLETILSPYQQHSTILATHCKFCPVP